MSLTSIMEWGFSEEVMKDIPFPIDVFIDDNCVASPISENRSLVGIAFDYMLRLELLRANPRAREGNLVGQYAIKHFDEKMSMSYEEDAHFFIFNFLGIFVNFFMEKMGYKDILTTKTKYKEALKNDQELKDKLHAIFTNRESLRNTLRQIEKDYLDARKKYISDGIMNDELVLKTLRFSMLDYFYRGSLGSMFGDTFIPDNSNLKDEVDDLKALHHIIPDYFKTLHRSVWLNPDFKETSLLVGGADADLIVDQCLIDIKTTSKMQVNEFTWSQLVGYLILAEEARKHIEFPLVRKFGVYFSRFGKLWLINAKYVYQSPRYNRLKNKLFKYQEKLEKRFQLI